MGREQSSTLDSGFLCLGFLSFFAFGAAAEGEGDGEGFVIASGNVERLAGSGVITLRAGLAVDGSKAGSSAVQPACQAWKSCLALSPSWVLVSGVNATDLRLLAGVNSAIEGSF